MNPYLQAISTVVAPLAVFFIPGVALVPIKPERSILAWLARVILWSTSLATLLPLAAVFAGYPAWLGPAALASVFVIAAIWHRRTFFTLPTLWYFLGSLIGFVLLYAAFSAPYIIRLNGLPTGDAQKTVFWAEQIRTEQGFPNYQLSRNLLNRDPVDFYTPGLHALAAQLFELSDWPLTTIGLLAIAASIATATVAAAIGKDIFDTDGKIFPATLIVILALSNWRFLRYLREPGYHLQNVMGELFLFGILMLALALIHRWRTKDAILMLLVTLALVFTHQFSAFVGFFALLPAALVFVVSRRRQMSQALRRNLGLSLLAAFTATVFIGGAFFLRLNEKLPHLFTASPHLANELPSLADYPRLFGGWYLLIGSFGWALLAIHSWKKHEHVRETASLCAVAVMLAFLSQGPRFGIDIPPVRALLYACIPLAITGAYGIAMLYTYLGSQVAGKSRRIAQVGLTAALLIGMAAPLLAAFGGPSAQAPTNSTLTPGLLYLLDTVIPQLPAGALLTDDYGQRATSWFLLSGRPTFSRLASDIHRQMQESRQNPLRRDLYLRQLEFEKIYSLASSPLIAPLLAKNQIAAIAGTDDTSYLGLSQNPFLREVGWADTTHLFTVTGYPAPASSLPPDIEAWLLKASTLANDIGDNEDMYDYLPASLSATRTSLPQAAAGRTFRVTTAPLITLDFNMADYAQALWDKDNDGRLDGAAELLVTVANEPAGLQLNGQPLQTIAPRIFTATIAAEALIPNDKGHLSITIQNPHGQPVAIDLIALGPARVP